MIIDFHNDTILKVFLYDFDFYSGHTDLEVDLPKIIDGRVNALFFAFCTSPVYSPSAALKLVKKLRQTFDEKIIKDGKQIRIASSRQDVLDNLNKGIISAILSLEGAYCIDSGKDIDIIKELGFKLITLTHTQSTTWAGSDNSEGSLSEKGKGFIKALNDNDIIIDVAHTSLQTIRDVCAFSKKPVVITHCGVKALCDSRRALEDDYLLMVKDTGGVIGVSFFPEHLRNSPKDVGLKEYAIMSKKIQKVLSQKDATEFDKFKPYLDACYYGAPIPENLPGVEAVYDTITYLINLVGEDHVALGSDFDGIPYRLDGFGDISKVPKLINLLNQEHDETTINKICSGNILKLL